METPESQTASNVNEFIEQRLDLLLGQIERVFDAHALTYYGPILVGADDVIRVAIENLSGGQKQKRLVVALTTGGGSVEVSQRIVETLRQFYEIVEFIIPNVAYSAGTIIALSGDKIHMDYYSRLGPIDPQVEWPNRGLVPALGYVKRYKELIEKAKDGKITIAEVQLLINGFDQGILYQFEQASELAKTLLKEWLPKHRFKNSTESAEVKRMTADRIATALIDSDKWHSHGRGISKDVLHNDLGLEIDDFGADKARSERIRHYHTLLSDHLANLQRQSCVHTIGAFRPLWW